MIYGYARVSSEGQVDGTSLDTQEEALRQAGAEKIYKDAYSGTSKHRPQLDKLLTEIRPGDTLVVTKMDRLARSLIDGLDLIDNQLLNNNVSVRILDIGIMDDTPAGRLTRQIYLAFAEYERNMIA